MVRSRFSNESQPPGRDTSLDSLLARIPVFLWRTDAELRISDITGSALDRAGIRATELLGEPVENLFGTAESIAAHGNALSGHGASFEIEINGRTLEAHVEPLAAEGAGGVAGVALDVTERLVAETALRLSEESNRSLIDEAPYAICRITESGQMLQVNPAMREMLGYDSECEGDLLMRDLPLFFSQPQDFGTLRRTLLAGAAVQGFETVWKRRDGGDMQIRLGGSARRAYDGSVLCFDLLAENVTEKKELAARLQQAEKMQMIGQLAGGVAHDFNNLLTVINGYCDLLILEEAENGCESHLPQLRMIRQAGERASGLTQQLLAFSRRQVTFTRPVSLDQVVDEVASLSERLIGENIRIVQELGSGDANVMADAPQMHQMLMNLVVNARDAMPQGGTLTLRTEVLKMPVETARQLDLEPGEYAVLTVADTGIGMDENIRAHIFEPFFTTKDVGKGTGLGLATVFALVRKSRGAIEVQSSPGQGSSFRIFLPLAPGQPEAAQREAVSGLVRGSSTILVVEDDALVRRFTTTVLGDAGYNLLQAPDGETAIEIARKYTEPIHILVTDMVMPGLTGLAAAEEILRERPEMRVLVVSGYSEKLSGEPPIVTGFHYLQKPFSPGQLARAVNEILEIPLTLSTAASSGN